MEFQFHTHTPKFELFMNWKYMRGCTLSPLYSIRWVHYSAFQHIFSMKQLHEGLKNMESVKNIAHGLFFTVRLQLCAMLP